MNGDIEPERWRAVIAVTFARQMRRRRKQLGLTAQELADICTDQYGYPLTRSTLASLESGRRSALSVTDVLVLAHALRVPPLQLLCPTGFEEEVEILPGRQVPALDALRWFDGEQPGLPGDPGDRDADTETLGLHRTHQRLVEAYQARQADVRRVLAAAGDALQAADHQGVTQRLDIAAEMLRGAEEPLRKVRQRFRDVGLTPPPLPGSLARLDEQPTS